MNIGISRKIRARKKLLKRIAKALNKTVEEVENLSGKEVEEIIVKAMKNYKEAT